MSRKRLQPEEIILKLREVEIQQGKDLLDADGRTGLHERFRGELAVVVANES